MPSAVVGAIVGVAVGAAVGVAVGAIVGVAVGTAVGVVVGAVDGAVVGTAVGSAVGSSAGGTSGVVCEGDTVIGISIVLPLSVPARVVVPDETAMMLLPEILAIVVSLTSHAGESAAIANAAGA